VRAAGNSDTVLIRNIYLNQAKQLVVEFDNPSHITPVAPQVIDYPGDKHDIILEFSDTSFAVGKVPRAKAVLDELTKSFSNVSSIAYAASNDATKARIKLSVSKEVTVHPVLAKVDQDSAVINLDLPVRTSKDTNQVQSTNLASSVTTSPTASPSNVSALAEQIVAVPPADKSPATAVAAKSAPEPAASTQTPLTETAVNNSATATSSTTAAAASATPASDAAPTTTNKGLVHGLKGVWQSGLKASSNVGKLGKLFGANKVDSAAGTPDTKQDVSSSPPSTKGDDTARGADTPAPPTASAAPAASVAEAVTQAPETAAVNKPADQTVSSVPSTSPADSVVAAIPVAQSKIDTTSLVEALTPTAADQIAAKPIVENVDKVATAAITPTSAKAETNAGDIPPSAEDRKLLDLPRISLSPKEATDTTINKDPLTPPLNADEAKPAASAGAVPANLFAPGVPLTTKPLVADASLTAGKAGDQPSTEEQSAGDGSSIGNSGSKKLVKNVELKAMTAHSGGKDYYPPTVTTEGQDTGYGDETLKHYNEAVRFHIAGKLPEAIAEYHAAIAGNPRMEEAHSNLGLIFNQQNKYDQAMSEFHKALAINPKDAITYNGIGAAMRAQKNMMAAIKNWQTAISLDPNLASAHYNLGTAYEIDKDLEKALAEYKLAVRFDQKLGEAYYHMGLILQKMNNRQLALEQFKQAVKLSAQADYSQDAKHRVDLLSQKKDITNM
jgi:Tfp pilus assembly protein PilF